MTECKAMAEDLTALAMGELSGAAREAIETHLASCDSCREALEETRRILSLAHEMPGIPVTRRLHEGVLEAVSVEQEFVRLSLVERIRLAAGFGILRLKQSSRVRVLAFALAAQIAILIFLVFASDFIVQTTPVPDESLAFETSSGVKKLPPEPEEGEGLVFLDMGGTSDKKRWVIEPPSTMPSPPTIPVVEAETAFPMKDLNRRIERENRLELSLYRMYARVNIQCKYHVLSGRGGDDRTDYAVGRGLKWLRHQQEEDGSWDPGGLHGGDPGARVGVTALAIAAFLSEGNTLEKGRYATAVGDGIRYLKANQDSEGLFGRMEGAPGVSLFNHSTAVFALAEHFILSRGAEEEALRRGIESLIDQTSRTVPDEARPAMDAYSETWTAMALRTCAMTGIHLDGLGEAALAAEDRVALLAENEPWRSFPRAASVPTPPIYTATEGALVALFDEKETAQRIDELPLPDRSRPETLFTLLENPDFREPSFLFFIGTALCEDRDPFWDPWNKKVKEILLEIQQTDGAWLADGDWPWIDGGDVYTTVLHLLTLQVYYRYIKLEENCP
ncbi:MAG: zf-HC2 domain-containing protein [Planctomycetota bacterium]